MRGPFWFQAFIFYYSWKRKMMHYFSMYNFIQQLDLTAS